MASRSELLNEALRRGLIKREDLEGEARRRGIGAYSPEALAGRKERTQEAQAAGEVQQFGRVLTAGERLTRGAIKYGAPVIGGIAAQLAAPAAPVVAGAIGVAGGAAEGELQLQRYDIRHGLRKEPVSLTESLKAGGEAGAEALVTGGLIKGTGRMFGKLGGIPKAGSRYLEEQSVLGTKAAAIRSKPVTEKRLLGRLRRQVDIQRSQLTPEKVRMNAIVDEAEAAGVTVDPTSTIEALIGGKQPITSVGVSGLRDAERTAQRILNATDDAGRVPIKRWKEITEELSGSVATKYSALNVRGSAQLHVKASHAASEALKSSLPGEYGELGVEVATRQTARKFVQGKIGTGTKPKMSGVEFIRSVSNDPEEMDWLRQFHPQLAKEVDYLAIRRMLKPDEKSRADEIMGVLRTLAMPVTRTVGKTTSMLVKPATVAGGAYKPLKRTGLYKGKEEK